MAGIYLKVGTVRAQKSSMLINTAHRYDDKGVGVFCIKSSRDTRDVGVIASRNGLKRECYMLDDSEDLLVVIGKEKWKHLGEFRELKIILIDEGQLLSRRHIKQILELSKDYSILVYGLKTDYKAQNWESMAILENFAKDVEIIKNPCEFCDSLAKLNLRLVDGEPVVNGSSVIIDESLEESEFVPVCPKCYMEKAGIEHI